MPSRTMVSPTPRSQHNIDDLYEHADYQKLIYMYGELGVTQFCLYYGSRLNDEVILTKAMRSGMLTVSSLR